MSAESITLVNGVRTDQLPANDRGLAYGDGLFETFRVTTGRVTLEDLHFQRLQQGAERLGLPIDLSELRREIAEVASTLSEGVLKLTVTRGSGQRGYRLPEPQRPVRIVQTGPLPAHIDAYQHNGVQLFRCKTTLARQPLLAGIKHLNRLEQVLARAEWSDPSIVEGLLTDTEGAIIEGTMSNVFLRIDGGWVTPDLSQSGVQGVMRDFLIQNIREGGQAVSVRRIDERELASCSEWFCCNSVMGVWPVVAMGDMTWPIGAATRTVQAYAMHA